MTKLAVPILVRSVEQALSASELAAARGGDLVELRIDEFTGAPQQLTRLIQDAALPSIVTCRPTWEGGGYEGDEDTRITRFEHACAGARQPAYIDVELAAYQRSAALRQRINMLVDHPGQVGPTDTGLILSSHDFDGRPIDLYQRIEAMAAAPACRVMKLAWRARSLRDNLEAFQIVTHRHKPTIALCMGDEGLPSRVLAKKFGALLTFAALAPGAGTAIGQPTIDDLKRLYRWDALGAQTRVFGVIGHPVGHSQSPLIHNAGFEAADYDGVYLPMPIPPLYEAFKATVGAWLEMADLHFGGASVTIPHKENLLRFVQERGGEIEPLARRIGAANTLAVRPDGSLYACNTDYAAALDAVCDGLGITRDELKGMRVAVIGAGGAARAIVAGFAQCGATVVVYNRTLQKAQALAAAFSGGADGEGDGKVVAARLDKLCDSCCQVYINCTPVGMHPNVDATPVPDTGRAKGWQPGAVVFDTVYNPRQTRLLTEARAAGCLTIPGNEMFVRQGAEQFRLWTGAQPPVDLFRMVLAEAGT